MAGIGEGPGGGVDVELRVHGVHGTSAEAMLEDPFPHQIAGDANARFFRTTEPTRPERPRYVREAFSWSRFTSGSAGRAFWLLFLPFTLVNLSRYMILSWDDRWPSAEKDGFRPPCLGGVDAVLRVLGLLMTLSLLTTSVYVSAEVVAHRCILTAACLDQDGHWLEFADGWPTGAALLLALVAPAAVLLVVAFLGRTSNVLGDREKVRWMSQRRFGDDTFWWEAREVAALRAAHLSACGALLGVLYSGFGIESGSGQPVGGWLLLGIGVVVLALSLVVTHAGCLLRWIGDLGPRRRAAPACGAVGYAVVSCGWTAADLWDSGAYRVSGGPREAAALPGLEVATVVLIGLAGGLTVYLFVLASIFRCSFRRSDLKNGARPATFQPMVRGFAMPLTAAVGLGLFYGLSTGLTYRLADLVGTPSAEQVDTQADRGEIVVPLSTSYVTGASVTLVVAVLIALCIVPLVARILQRRYVFPAYIACLLVAVVAVGLWSRAGALAGLAAAAVALGLLVTVVVLLVRVGPELDETVAQDYPRPFFDVPGLVPGKEEQLSTVAGAWRQGQAKYRYSHGLVALGLVSVTGVLLAAATVAWRATRARDSPPKALLPVLEALSGSGAWIATTLLAALVFVGVRTFQIPAMRTATGVVWDLLSFWPRIAHPLCPPPYGGRAVLELTDRVRTICISPDSTVILSAHSQGSVLCVATVTALSGDKRSGVGSAWPLQHVGLVTYGSQLQWAYARLFPCFVGYNHLAAVHGALGHRWRSLYRETDPLGGPVLSWHEGRRLPAEPDEVREGRCGFHLIPAGSPAPRVPAIAGAVRHGHDVRLLDPVELGRRRDRSVEPIRGHGDYYGVEAFDIVVDEVIDLVRRPGPAR